MGRMFLVSPQMTWADIEKDKAWLRSNNLEITQPLRGEAHENACSVRPNGPLFCLLVCWLVWLVCLIDGLFGSCCFVAVCFKFQLRYLESAFCEARADCTTDKHFMRLTDLQGFCQTRASAQPRPAAMWDKIPAMGSNG